MCEVDGVIVGYAYANKIRERPAYEYSVELSVYVDSRYQNIGVGKALYSRLLPELSKRGFYTAYAYSSKRAKRRNAPRVRVLRGGSVAQCRIQARKVA